MTALRSRRGKASVIETELKFEVDPARAEALRAALLAQGAETLDLAAHYFDSQDGRLAAAGIALRLRREGQHWLQTVKASRDAQAFERLEHTLRREAPAPDAVLAPEPALHAGSAVGARLARALGEPAPELQERYAVLVTRLQLRQCGDRAEVELAFDTGRVQGGGREAPVCELEFELKRGGWPELCAAARPWIEPYGLLLSTETKAARGERLLGRAQPAGQALPLKLPAMPSVTPLLRAVLGACLAQLLPPTAALGRGSEDPEQLRQARVALRRLRTALRELGGLCEALPVDQAPLIRAFRGLGAARDRQALRAGLGPELARAGFTGGSWLEGGVPNEAVARVLREPRLQELLLTLLAFVMTEDSRGEALEPEALRAFLARRLGALRRKLRQDARDFVALKAAERHRCRKRVKRLRYLVGFVAPLYPGPVTARLLKRLKQAQRILGRQQDLAVAQALAKQAARQGDADAARALGWLKKRRKRARKASAQALLKLRRTAPFW